MTFGGISVTSRGRIVTFGGPSPRFCADQRGTVVSALFSGDPLGGS